MNRSDWKLAKDIRKVLSAVAPDPVTRAGVAGLAIAVDRLGGRAMADERTAMAARTESALRTLEGAEQELATLVCDAVRAEVKQADILGIADADIVKQFLLGDVELLAREAFVLLRKTPPPSPLDLVQAIEQELTQRLDATLGNQASLVARPFAAAVVLKLELEPKVRGLLTRRFESDVAAWFENLRSLSTALVHEYQRYAEALSEELQNVRERVTDVGAICSKLLLLHGPPTAEERRAVLGTNFPGMLHSVRERLRERLTMNVPRTGPEVPDFPLLPTRLEWLEPKNGQEGADWSKTDIGALGAKLAAPRHGMLRVLVLGRAGMGKTTAMYALAERLAKDKAVLPLPVADPNVWNRLNKLTVAALSRELATHPMTHPDELKHGERWQDVLDSLLWDGRAVVLLDGIDRVPEGLRWLRDARDERYGRACVVAACREELIDRPGDEPFDLVVRLLGIDTEAEATQTLIGAPILGFLSASLDARDRGHPLFIHAARLVEYLDYSNGAIPAAGGLASLLRRYVEALLWLGEEHSGRGGDAGGSEDQDLDQRLAISEVRQLVGAVALRGLRERLPWSVAGVVPRTFVPEYVIVDEAESLARKPLVGNDGARRAMSAAEKHHALLHRVKEGELPPGIAEPTTQDGLRAYAFHHELLQEFLAAEQVLREVSVASDAAGRYVSLTDLIRQVIEAGRPAAGAGGGSSGGPEPEKSRFLRLRFWEFIADVLAKSPRERGLSPMLVAQREELVRLLVTGSFRPASYVEPVDGLVQAALMRVRDDLLAVDIDLGATHGIDGEAAADPVVEQFGGTAAPDAFMALCWSDERAEIRAQVAQTREWLAADDRRADRLRALGVLQKELPEQLMALLRAQDGRDWRVTDCGPTLGAWLADEQEPRWLLVPPGEFVAGSGENGYELAVRVERVDRPFWIARDPVRVSEFAEFLGVDGRHPKRYNYDFDKPWWRRLGDGAQNTVAERQEPWDWEEQSEHDDRPVVGVSWFEAAAYCLWRNCDEASQHSGNEAPLGPYRLPTEREWEKAARGLFGRRWPWGCAWRPELVVFGDEAAAGDALSAVEVNLNVSPFGVRGMAGNVWEWTSTTWKDQHFGPGVWTEDELGAAEPTRVISLRGGSFYDVRRYVRCAFRYRVLAGLEDLLRGFRCVRDVDAP